MSAVRSLGGTVGVLLGAVVLLVCILLSPVLLPLAALGLLVFGGWKFWRLKHKVEKKVDHGHRKVRKAGNEVGKKAGQALGR